MLFLPGNILVSLLLLVLPLRFALAQTTAPYPYAYCSNNVIDGGSYCPGSSTNCCAASAACCAGGCCPQLYDCIYQGTANEACCPANDPSACGAAQPEATPTCSPNSGFKPDHTCVGTDSDWPCPYNQPCDYETGGCLPAVGGDGCSSGAAATSYSNSESAAATSYGNSDSAAASTSFFDNSAAATSFQGGAATQSPTVELSSTTNGVGVTQLPSRTSSASSAATATTKKNEGVAGGLRGYRTLGMVLSFLLAILGFG